MANSEYTFWNKLQELKEKNPKFWRILIAGLAILSLVVLFVVTSFLFPSVGSKLYGLALAPVNLVTGLFGKKADATSNLTSAA